MKTVHYLMCGLVLIALTNATQLFGQPGAGIERKEYKEKTIIHRGESMIPNLTDDQQAKIKDLRLAHFKEVKTYRNQLGELKAKQRTLTTADKSDTKAIDANIDEITKALGSIMKSKVHFQLQVRSLLTDEQKVFFDMHGMKSMMHEGKGEARNNNRRHHEQSEMEMHLEE